MTAFKPAARERHTFAQDPCLAQAAFRGRAETHRVEGKRQSQRSEKNNEITGDQNPATRSVPRWHLPGAGARSAETEDRIR
eukprot:m.6945 g.6945  ORF g.6945 m.6945 type:complete len:81 (+) comp5025_c0_seq1:56-298(+)